MCSKCPPAASGRRWRRSPTARSVTADPERLTHFWCVISLRQCTMFKSIQLVLNELKILNDSVVSVIFWADACAIQYEFIVANGQTVTFALHKVVYSDSTKVRWTELYSFTSNRLSIKSANVSQSYSKNKSGTVFFETRCRNRRHEKDNGIRCYFYLIV